MDGRLLENSKESIWGEVTGTECGVQPDPSGEGLSEPNRVVFMLS